MTERQAWQRLAEMVPAGKCESGLCPSIYGLQEDHGLSFRVRLRMLNRIDKLPDRYYDSWKWDFSEKGNKARAAYCRRQVARLTKRPAKRPARKGKK